MDATNQRAACATRQEAAFRDTPYVPQGIFLQPTAYRRDIRDIPQGFPLFFTIRRGRGEGAVSDYRAARRRTSEGVSPKRRWKAAAKREALVKP